MQSAGLGDVAGLTGGAIFFLLLEGCVFLEAPSPFAKTDMLKSKESQTGGRGPKAKSRVPPQKRNGTGAPAYGEIQHEIDSSSRAGPRVEWSWPWW